MSEFDQALYGLLEACPEAEGISLRAMIDEYDTNVEFKRRIDLAALNLSCPTSEAVH